MIALIILTWLGLGGWSAYYYWTDTFDLTIRDLSVILLGAIGGPFIFMFFTLPLLLNFNKEKPYIKDTIIFKKRTK